MKGLMKRRQEVESQHEHSERKIINIKGYEVQGDFSVLLKYKINGSHDCPASW